ncbi:uncharacterized protein LOC133662728 [Entelurus aequoreus]|uniref:uncharacterized protein LOC133662728 n=1 Tax=Entelurus aequoreus TaxID=161455 RepID=UPI002B1D02AC|nr:uncharacterized protein LOC133662728 [Entelurus aequoreus]XP_061922838.1 uncharacterized protein LOC133662728 [Entelurus aequoreus]
MRKMCLMLTMKRKFGQKRTAEKRKHRSSSRHPHCQSSQPLTFQSPASTRPLQPIPDHSKASRPTSQPSEKQHFQAQSKQECIQLKPVPDRSSQYQTTPASTSQYQTAPRSSRNALDSEFFQLNMKVQNILENQGEIMRMLRGLAAQSVGPESVDVQDLIDQPFKTLEQLKAFCERLDTDLLLRKQLVKALTALGGQNLADTVRTMLRKTATNEVLEQLGLRGKSGKVAFEDLPLYRIINKVFTSRRPQLKWIVSLERS